MGSTIAMPPLKIPVLKLSSASSKKGMPVVGLGTAAFPLDEAAMKKSVIDAISLGYRHIDTAPLYGTEKLVGDAIKEAIGLGYIESQEELFVTSKLFPTDTHAHLVVPALKKSLQTLQLDYVDLYLIHYPLSAKPAEGIQWPIPEEDLLPTDYKAVWAAMEECQRLGLAKSIGVSNFTIKKLEVILSSAVIPPSVNQVELSPIWHAKKHQEFCKAHDIKITAFSPTGAKGVIWGTDLIMDNEVLKEIANKHGKTVAQVSMRWIIEQGASFVAKSYRKERLKENMELFDWALTKEDLEKIDRIPQKRFMLQNGFVSENGPFKSLEELWDGEL